MIAEVITKKLKKHCRPRTLRRLLRRMGFSYVKPRTVTHKSASQMEQEEFMEPCRHLVSEKSAEDYTMLAQDEAGVRLGACGEYGWRFKADGCEVGATITVTQEDDSAPERKTVRITIEFGEEPMGPINMVAYMWNTDRKAVIIRIIDAIEVAAAPPESAMQAADPEPL